MSALAEHYRRQYPWRPWREIHALLGDLRGETVLDLGAGIGDQAADLARLGAQVIGVERNEELVEVARARSIPGARFLCEDILAPALDGLRVHGIWLAFAAAYFPDFDALLARAERWLLPAGWLAIVEVDDLFGHEPLAERHRALAEAYYARSLEEGVHAFFSRGRVRAALSARGFGLEVEEELPDRELAFDGPADADVLEAWRARLEGMLPRFVERFGAEAAAFGPALLDALRSPEHRSLARVWFMLARAPERRRGV
jgi:SAM-dependent methyltransferase